MIAARQEFCVSIECPGCGQSGSVIWEDVAATYRTKVSHRTLKVLSSGFRQGEDATPDDPKIICNVCDAAQSE